MVEGRVSPWTLWKNRNFSLLWVGQLVSFIGDYFYFLAIPILVERLTGSTTQVGIAVISSALPLLLLGPVAGVFVDRWDRKRTMIVADLLRGLIVLLCLFVRTPEQVWIYYLVGFGMSCVSRFFFPAQNAVLPLIVPEEKALLAANGMMQVIQTVGLLAGPALAGVTIEWLGASTAFLLDAFSYLFSAAMILRMQVPQGEGHPRPSQGQVTAVWADLLEGVHYILQSPTLIGVLICLSVVQLAIGAINVIWVPFLQRTFEVGPSGLGVVDAMQGAGMVLGGLALGFLSARLSKPLLVGLGIILIGLCIGGIGVAPLFGYVLALGLGIGLGLVPAQSALMTMMQIAVPDRKRGRVGSALNALPTAASLLSMAIAAITGDLVGLPTIYLAAGGLLILSGFLAFRIPEPVAPPRAEEPLSKEGPSTELSAAMLAASGDGGGE